MKITINRHAPVQCTKSIKISARREKVWSILTDIDRWPEWQIEISKAKIKGSLAPETIFEWKTGGANIKSILHTVEPSNKFGWTGKTFGMYAIHNWQLIQEGEETIVTVEESLDGMLAKIFKGSFNQSMEQGMQRWLEQLKKVCEKG